MLRKALPRVYQRAMPRPPLDTPLTQLRLDAPGSLRQSDISAFMGEAGLELARITISDFERGKYLPADPRFIPLYAQAIGKSRKAVREAYEQARALYERGRASEPRRRTSPR